MSQELVAALLRKIGNTMPSDIRDAPDHIPGLSLAQVCLLAELYQLERTEKEPPSLSVLARNTGLSKATICMTLKELRRSGYITARTNDTDNRRKELILTERAWAAEDQVRRLVCTFDQALCRGIPEADLHTTARSLEVILQNVKELRATASRWEPSHDCRGKEGAI